MNSPPNPIFRILAGIGRGVPSLKKVGGTGDHSFMRVSLGYFDLYTIQAPPPLLSFGLPPKIDFSDVPEQKKICFCSIMNANLTLYLPQVLLT